MMNIKRIYTNNSVMSLDHKMSFDSDQHKISYVSELGLFRVDNTYLTHSNVREVVIQEGQEVSAARVNESGIKKSARAPSLKDGQSEAHLSNVSPDRKVVVPAHTNSVNSADVISTPKIEDNWFIAVPDQESKKITKRKASSKPKTFTGEFSK